ncbi:hypothetical protein JD969_01250 [Planctomycetota bacterium]|nr:hypothetical protein JD969_01250 [Planctomycetota bacterium]
MSESSNNDIDEIELTEIDMYCLNCDYDLYGIDSHSCPECGEPFDPNDERTFRCFSDKDGISTKTVFRVLLYPFIIIGLVILFGYIMEFTI